MAAAASGKVYPEGGPSPGPSPGSLPMRNIQYGSKLDVWKNIKILFVPDQERTREWYTMAMKLLGGPEQLKASILNVTATHGVVAALLSTIAITVLLLGPSNYEPTSNHNTAAKVVLVVSEVLALGCGLACVNLCGQQYGCINYCPSDFLIDYLVVFKGRFYVESIAMVNACVVLLMVGVVAVIYLLYGAMLFWIAIAAAAIYGTHTIYVFDFYIARLFVRGA
ncbi:hypothetical protein HYH02_000835 [Chlamydomonas schloesseri]|uniref:Uncharacterized protein n=1 Tax=Chlamydomonas schloesseri TaxID=2026947 RepID=A0A835WZB5_9CHLO|nr:hypothetical protein HYH02_000835 [Chlamydomonas schloesseri]|eukprot:KAG2455010.1 hypothetical protein HYH02_000835 [Chlamydomonas schloesseri]